MITGENFIGVRRSGKGEVRFTTFNPLQNQENIWSFCEASDAEIDEAAQLAWMAFRQYSTTSPHERARFLETIADEISGLGEELISTYTMESGLAIERARSERARTVFQLQLFAEMLRNGSWREVVHEKGDLNRKPLPKPDLRKTTLPLGPVAVFGSSNFPLAYSTAGGDTASALAAGCPVVVKSHPMHAGTGELVAGAVARAAQKTGMPNGVFSNLNSSGVEVGTKLVLHPKIKAVGFTGSFRGGKALFDVANQRAEPIPVFAEMGSINPVVITRNALVEKGKFWAEKYALSITQGTGQFCTNPGLILAVDGIELSSFAKMLAEEVEKQESTCMLHPKMKAAYSELKESALSQSGVESLTHDRKVAANFADQTVAWVAGERFLANPTLHKEVFGPFSLIVRCEDENQLLSIIDALEGQLTGTIIATESEEVKEIVNALQHRVGRIIYNGVPTGVEVCEAMHHGGPYPATTDARYTAVGPQSIRRWLRPIVFQNFPAQLLPEELKSLF